MFFDFSTLRFTLFVVLCFFFFNDTATTEIYTTHNTPYTTLFRSGFHHPGRRFKGGKENRRCLDERSEEHTSELQSLCVISYAVFCLKKKKQQHHKVLVKIRKKEKHKQQLLRELHR